MASVVEGYYSSAHFENRREDVRLARGGCFTQETAAGANSGSVFDRCTEQGRRRAAELSRLALIFRVLPNETQVRIQFAIDTRNIPELGIWPDIPLTEYRADVVSTRTGVQFQ